jgi:hypothetical protein
MGFLRAIGSLLRFDRANWRAVALCILAASIFWLFNAFNKNYATNIKFPLRFEYDYEKFVPVHHLPAQITINVSGNGWDLFRNHLGLKLPELTIPLDRPLEVKKIVAGSLPPLLQPQIEKLKINFLATDTIRLQLDERDFHKYKVAIDMTDFLFKDGFGRISPIVVLPDSITLEGPKSVLHQMPDSIYVAIKGNKVSQNHSEEIEISIEGETVIISPPIVKVLFDVGPTVDLKGQLKLSNPSKRFAVQDSVLAWFRVPAKREEEFRELLKEISASPYSKRPRQVGMVVPRVHNLPSYAQLIKIDSVNVTAIAK